MFDLHYTRLSSNTVWEELRTVNNAVACKHRQSLNQNQWILFSTKTRSRRYRDELFPCLYKVMSDWITHFVTYTMMPPEYTPSLVGLTSVGLIHVKLAHVSPACPGMYCKIFQAEIMKAHTRVPPSQWCSGVYTPSTHLFFQLELSIHTQHFCYNVRWESGSKFRERIHILS